MTDTIIEKYGKKVLLLRHAIEQNSIPDPSLSDIWVVNHEDEILVSNFLHQIIRSEDLKIYLKPIYLQKDFKPRYITKDLHLKYLSDGYIKELNFIDKIPFIEQINMFVEKYEHRRNVKDFEENEFLIQKTFDYFYTRKRTIKPVLSHKSLAGYSYRRLDANYFNSREASIYSQLILREAYLKGLLSRHYMDTSHLCKKCSSGFLNYRETCPKCHRHDLKTRNIIHHFRCAYVGGEDDFIFNNKLFCPKCSTELKNIGVDYDKPGKIFKCKDAKCLHEFQDAPVRVVCVDCETEQLTQELMVRKIYKYKITDLGIEKGLFLK